MSLELLPNELLFDIFDYLDGVNLLRAFYGLNFRFNFLLYNQYQTYRLQFQAVSKRNFDIVCQQHLPFIADRVVALSLSDYNNTPEQINLFLSYIPSFKLFTCLRSLTLCDIRSYPILLKLLDECHGLTHLSLASTTFSDGQADFQLIVNKIWSLPKLTNCYSTISFGRERIFCIPKVISSSLECLTICRSKFRGNDINQLFDHTPHLKSLSIYVAPLVDNNYTRSSLSTLTKVNLCLFSEDATSQIIDIFRNMPNLRHLDITIWNELIDDRKWEQIIRNYLPKLKIFLLEMKKSFFSRKTYKNKRMN
jgi:hypothetical protein